ncbi:hypothetical protein I4641_08795 [Waterburya agarophytonicola K14]|uniref:Uncharacterized protein n=1 Tax=Waterburya agarophytonicola KI4 TaxID=2874699 RepID=A0A964FH25_9CYAN|nr:hypothetical protein [Waterburya agarophytonicola]MCC0177073.1 hypothetical protein [Waterburya agarophytonicola KI4]
MTQPFQFPNGQLAYSAEDLLKLCQQFPDDGVNYLVREDLEKWLAYIGQEDIARCAANARQTPLEDRQKLEEFLTKCHALSSPESRDLTEKAIEPTPVAVETPVVEAKPEPIPVVVETPVVETNPVKQQAENIQSSNSSNSTEAKPSFFRAIARLIVNILYRNKG